MYKISMLETKYCLPCTFYPTIEGKNLLLFNITHTQKVHSNFCNNKTDDYVIFLKKILIQTCARMVNLTTDISPLTASGSVHLF